MGKKLTITQVKKELARLSNEELVDIICKLYKSSKEAADQEKLTMFLPSVKKGLTVYER